MAIDDPKSTYCTGCIQKKINSEINNNVDKNVGICFVFGTYTTFL